MKKRDLATLAMIGISAGLLVGGCQQQNKSSTKMSAAEQMSPDMQTFYNSLSPEGQRKFMELDAQHRMMAIEMSNQKCTGKNNCASMGGCATAAHACAGQNGCKGQGGTPVRDSNRAVEVQHRNQTNQRQRMNNQMNGGNQNNNGQTNGGQMYNGRGNGKM